MSARLPPHQLTIALDSALEELRACARLATGGLAVFLPEINRLGQRAKEIRADVAAATERHPDAAAGKLSTPAQEAKARAEHGDGEIPK